MAPGNTYRARLLAVKSRVPTSLHMYCDGQPLTRWAQRRRRGTVARPVAAGPVGKVRLNQHGRNTTFTVRVPYRVAPR